MLRSAVEAGSRVRLCPHVHPEACLRNRRKAPTQPATAEHGQHPPLPGRTSPVILHVKPWRNSQLHSRIPTVSSPSLPMACDQTVL